MQMWEESHSNSNSHTQALKSCTDALSSSMGFAAESPPPLTPPSSCQEVYNRDPSGTSKHYDLHGSQW
jgi:hypothetical protein